jgi:hypothetical protein
LEAGELEMKTIKLDKNHSTFAPEEKDMRPFEQAWREDFPNSLPNPNDVTHFDWNRFDGRDA